MAELLDSESASVSRAGKDVVGLRIHNSTITVFEFWQ